MHQNPRPTHGLGAQVGLFFLYLILWLTTGAWTTNQFDVTGTEMLLSFLGIGVGLGVGFLPLFRRVYLDRAPPGESG